MSIVLTHDNSIYFYGVLLYLIGYLLLEARQSFGRFVCLAGAIIFVLGFVLHLFGA
jgi:VIT1/CCC1 family predicted Fe2+/Mn2+ transporter